MIGGGIIMANVHQLIDCFNDTMHWIQTDPFLRAETMKSKADTVVYPVFWDNNQAAYFAKFANKFGAACRWFKSIDRRKNTEHTNVYSVFLAPQVGLEPTTLRLTAACSTN